MPLRSAIILLSLLASGSVLLATMGCSDRTLDVKVKEGLVTRNVEVGDGPAAKEGSRVEVQYVGTLPDGTPIVDSGDGGKHGHRWTVGDGTVIEGMDLGVRGMKRGGVREVKIPPHLHYGRIGYGETIPPNTPLLFKVTMVDVK